MMDVLKHAQTKSTVILIKLIVPRGTSNLHSQTFDSRKLVKTR